MVIIGDTMNIPAALFKAECLKLMDEVARTGRPVVITKHGKPVAQLVPVAAKPGTFFGHLKNSVRIAGKVIALPAEAWSAVSGDEDHLYQIVPGKPRARRATLKK